MEEKEKMLLLLFGPVPGTQKVLNKYLSNERVNSLFYQSALGTEGRQESWPGMLRP